MNKRNIHINHENVKYGPYNLSEVQAYISNGSLSIFDSYWHEGLTEWAPLMDIISLKPNNSESSYSSEKSRGYRPCPTALPGSQKKHEHQLLNKKKSKLWLIPASIIFSLAVLILSGEKPAEFESLEFSQGIAFLKNEKSPFSGTAISKYTNGKDRLKTHFHEGKEHGLYTIWNESGLKIYEAEYKNGVYSGLVKTWSPQGSIASISTYKDGQLTNHQKFEEVEQAEMVGFLTYYEYQ